MIIKVLQKNNSSNFEELSVKATMASDKSQQGQVAMKKDASTNSTVLIVMLCKWVDGEHGEEEILRQGCRAVIDYVKKSGNKKLAFDANSFSEYLEGISYTVNTLIEELSDKVEKEKIDDLSISLYLTEDKDLEELNEELDESISQPVFEIANHSYGEGGDPLKEQFMEFQKSLGKGQTFREYLIDIMERKGFRKSSEVYKASGVSKYTFSRLTNFAINPPHKPSKSTVAALTIGLKLTLSEAEEFYKAADTCLGKTEFIDKVIRFFIHKEIYNIDEVNFCLAYHHQPLLGEKMRGDNTKMK